MFAACLIVGTWLLTFFAIEALGRIQPLLRTVLEMILIFFCLSARSLAQAAMEGAQHSSPNAGYAEAAFAGALAVKLNGPNYYQGKLVDKPYIGVRFGQTFPAHIKKACDLMLLSSFLWLIFLMGGGFVLKIVY